ncbi:LOW QUALITY PROTEIN: uncharacterized protein LOC106163305 [Lingula anatina]|uniref:LOW QUALITY PROTEIN: uncharacterized protein LOC106163305 n=1 Tax=Lingula anatina TaxID=7574 RepID=A0A1S3IFR7_LINAN|nr:LOW QUALITY PROTEIN: uncharacterized protein LOC106163305 [Lingula anatina]|eukprot:XP_013396314.1 LOW QUALITY PROTEIN: uncharacterized protein LOC106163305 [Lingula anatina]
MNEIRPSSCTEQEPLYFKISTMPSFLPYIDPPSRELTLKPTKGLRYATYDSPLSIPSVGTKQKPSEFQAYINTKQIYKKIFEWFDSWRPWQQKHLLAGLTERCSTSQLEFLATDLEPVFHRDFVASLKKRYPSAALRHQKPIKVGQLNRNFKDRLKHELKKNSSKGNTQHFGNIEVVIRGPSTEVTSAGGDSVPQCDEADNNESENVTEKVENTPQDGGDVNVESHTERQGTASTAIRYEDSREPSMERDARGRSKDTDGTDTDGEYKIPDDEKRLIRHLAAQHEAQSGSSDDEYLSDSSPVKGQTGALDAIAEKMVTSALDSVLHKEYEGSINSLAETMANSILQSAVDVVIHVNKYEDEEVERTMSRCSGKMSRSSSRMSQHKCVTVDEVQGLDEEIQGEQILLQDDNQEVDFSGEKVLTTQTTKDSIHKKQVKGTAKVTIAETASVTMFSTEDMPLIKSPPKCPLSQDSEELESRDSPLRPSPPSSSDSGKLRTRSVKSSNISTAEYFCADMWERLGPVQREVNTGSTRKLPELQEVYVPVQRSYKNFKWWVQQPPAGKVFVKAKRSKLSTKFKEQLEKVWEWMEVWQHHERLALLAELVKKCSPDVISSLAECLIQRLQDTADINMLPDHILINIFSFLTSKEIDEAGLVCRRWRYIADTAELWILKCKAMGAIEGVPNLTTIVMQSHADLTIDWRLAYGELKKMIHDMKGNLEARKQEGIPRIGGRFLPMIKNETRSVSAFSEGGEADLKYVTTHSMRKKQSRHRASSQGSGESDTFPYSDESNTEKFLSTPRKSLKHRRGSKSSKASKTKGKTGRDLKTPDESLDDLIGGEFAEMANKPLRKQMRRGGGDGDEDELALDIRPELHQATDIMGKCRSARNLKWQREAYLDLKNKQIQYAGLVKGVSRVRRLQGHMNDVLCVTFDRKRLFSGSMDRTIRLWDIRTGRSVHKLYGHKGGIWTICISDDRLYSGSWDTTIMVWDVISFKRIIVLSGHSDAVNCLKCRGCYLVSGSHDKTIRVWSTYSYSCERIIRGHKAGITCLEFDGRTIISGGADMRVYIHAVHSGECLRWFNGPSHPISCMAVQGDLLLCGTTGGVVYFWDKTSGECEAAVEAHQAPINGIDFHSGRFYTASDDAVIKEWDLITMTCVRSLHGHKGPVNDVKVSEDRVVTCSDDGNVRVWDVFTPPLLIGEKEEDTLQAELIDQRL